MKRILLASFMSLPAAAGAEPFLVKNGEPRAEIVIAQQPPGSTRLAAKELWENMGTGHIFLRVPAVEPEPPVVDENHLERPRQFLALEILPAGALDPTGP